jgi:hypothetical protein
MKKKFRTIKIGDENNWAWNVSQNDSYYRFKTFKVWKNKEIVYTSVWGGDSPNKTRGTITPKFVAKFIKIFLQDE